MMMTQQIKKKILDLIENYRIADAFAQLDENEVKSPIYARLKIEFMQGIQTVDFIDRLKTFVRNSDLSADNSSQNEPEKKNQSQATGNGNITLQEINLDNGSSITIQQGSSANNQAKKNLEHLEDFEVILQNAREKVKDTAYEKIIAEKTFEYQRWKLAQQRGDITMKDLLDKETEISKILNEILKSF